MTTKYGRFLFAAAGAALIACSTPQSRIRKNQAAFDSYPPQVQRDIQNGKVDVGFTNAQVAMALGDPDRVYSRETAASTQEVWAYGGGGGSSVGIGLGMASGGPGFFGGGVGLGTSPDVPTDRIRVIFIAGKVVAVEQRQR
jgi:hypothetical protein